VIADDIPAVATTCHQPAQRQTTIVVIQVAGKKEAEDFLT
jgi:hypothetical protein